MKRFKRARLANGVATILVESGQFEMNPHFDETNDQQFRLCGHTGPEAELESVLKWYGGDGTFVESPYFSGEFHPRIWRGPESPSPDDAGLRQEWITSVRIGRQLFGRLRELFSFVEPHSNNSATHGMQQRELLMLACTEVESAWKSILKANGISKKNDRWTTSDFARLIAPMRIAEWTVSISAHQGFGAFAPFGSWTKDQPTQSLPWYDAYNAVKHDRENAIEHATFANVVHAMGALFVMTVAQFGIRHLETESPFHPDEFRLISTPAWNLNELYISPLKSINMEWLGFDKWTPSNCTM